MTSSESLGATVPMPAKVALAEQGRWRLARWATRAQFGALGVLAGAWGVHIPSVKSQYGLDEGLLSLVLLAASLGAVASLLVAGRFIAWLGARRAAQCCAAVMGLMLALALSWPSLAWLLASMLLFGAAMSLFDVAINTEGSALETLAGRPIMGNLHGSFSVGGIVGSLLTAALLRAGVPATWQLLAVGAAVALWVGLSARGMLDTHPEDGSADGVRARFAWPRGPLLVLGLLIFAGMCAEGAMYDWGVLYLKQELGLPQEQAATGYAAFSAAMALARFGGDGLRRHFAERSLLRWGGGLSAAAMAVLLLSGHPVVALLGYALIGAGLAMVVPLLYNAATRVPGSTRAAAIAAVSSIGYSGFLLGPPLIGALARSWSLPAAMGVVVLASAVLAWGARHVPQPPRA